MSSEADSPEEMISVVQAEIPSNEETSVKEMAEEREEEGAKEVKEESSKLSAATAHADQGEKEKEKQSEGQELTAAAALTSLNNNDTGKESDDHQHRSNDDDNEEAEEGDAPSNEDGFKIPLRLTKSGRRRATPFPLKLMKVLSDKQFSDVIAWTPSGTAFNIVQPKAFVATILPEHFKSAKYSSFTRKLHRWGFMRHYRGPEAGAFFHKNFRRGRMDLVEKMTCYKPAPAKANAGRKSVRDDQSPAMDTSGSSREASLPPSMMAGVGLPLPGGFNSFMQTQQQGIPSQLFMQGFGGMSAMQQQQNLFLQQQAAAAAQQQQMLQQQSSSQMPGNVQLQQVMQQSGGSGDSGLDAAIEMEVTRRLKERINAAALSRQALSMMPPGQSQGHLQGHMPGKTQGVGASMMDNRFLLGAGGPMSAPGGYQSLPQGVPQGLPQGYGKAYDQSLPFNMSDSFALQGNFQGAKTA